MEPEMGKAKILSGYINKGLGKEGWEGMWKNMRWEFEDPFMLFFFLSFFGLSGEFLKGAV